MTMTQADLDLMGELDFDPEWVLAFVPPQAYGRLWDRLARPGFWELMPAADLEDGTAPLDAWTLDACRDADRRYLAGFAESMLGYPVSLEAGSFTRFFRRPVECPLYWVRRA
jgi:hypothetical protein